MARDTTEEERRKALEELLNLGDGEGADQPGSTIMNGVRLDPNRPEPPFPGGMLPWSGSEAVHSGQ